MKYIAMLLVCLLPAWSCEGSDVVNPVTAVTAPVPGEEGEELGGVDNVDGVGEPVPEFTTWILFATGLFGIWWACSRWHKHSWAKRADAY